jgi:hypothetical protein
VSSAPTREASTVAAAPVEPEGLRTVDRIVVGVGIGAAVALRIWILRTRLGQVNGDEAVVGLMAHRLAHHGQLRVFFWGQDYGGTLEAIVTAVLFRLFGTSVAALKAVPMLLTAVAAWLIDRVGRRMVSRRVAAYAAIAFLLGPGGIVYLSTSSRGFYSSTLVLGLLVALFTLRVVERPRSSADWLAMGLAAGAGFWQSPQILYFTVPAAIVLLARLRRAVWPGAAIAAAGFVVGAAPWLKPNLFDDWMRSLDGASLGEPHTTYLHRVHVFADQGVGVVLGLHVHDHWIGRPLVPVLAGVALVVALVAVARPPLGRRALLVAVLASYPFLFALFPASWTVGEGRYIVYLVPFVAIGLLYALRTRVLQIGLLALVLALSIVSLRALEDVTVLVPDRPVPRSNTALIDRLDALGVRHAFASYWIAYPVTFETREHVVVAPVLGTRFTPYDDAVRADPRPAWILLDGSRATRRFERVLRRRGIAYRSVRAGDFVIVLPRARVIPEGVDTHAIFR